MTSQIQRTTLHLSSILSILYEKGLPIQSALQIFQVIGYRQGEAEALLNLAQLHHDTNDSTQALHFCQQALAIASEIGIPLKDDCETLLRELNGEE